jgi:hypothetical protein
MTCPRLNRSRHNEKELRSELVPLDSATMPLNCGVKVAARNDCGFP